MSPDCSAGPRRGAWCAGVLDNCTCHNISVANSSLACWWLAGWLHLLLSKSPKAYRIDTSAQASVRPSPGPSPSSPAPAAHLLVHGQLLQERPQVVNLLLQRLRVGQAPQHGIHLRARLRGGGGGRKGQRSGWITRLLLMIPDAARPAAVERPNSQEGAVRGSKW